MEIQVIRGSNNQFKSAVEPFLRNNISAPNYTQTKRFLDGLWQTMLQNISKARDIDTASLQDLANTLKVRNAQDAVQYGLIDKLLYAEEFEARLKKASSLDDFEKPHTISARRYLARDKAYFQAKRSLILPNIAIIYASGTIHGGKSDYESIGDETLIKAIKTASENPLIKAIVLRVNSPGGDALASDLMWDALRDAKTKKPVVVSMGGMAASGGYYISCMADKIFADPTTITGSIGVFMVVPNAQKFFEDDLGIHNSRVKTAEHADMSYLQMSINSFTRPLTEVEKSILQEGVDDTYNDFLERVVEGRPTFNTVVGVDSIGQGRVWCGIDALKIGLVDTLGGLQDAVNYACNLVDEDDAKFLILPAFAPTGIEKLVSLMEGNQALIKPTLGLQLTPLLQEKVDDLKSLTTFGQAQARMIWHFDIE